MLCERLVGLRRSLASSYDPRIARSIVCFHFSGTIRSRHSVVRRRGDADNRFMAQGIGRLSLELHFWRERWSRDETGWHANHFNAHLQEHWLGLGAAAGAPVFVPLCGKSLDMLWLAGQGYRVLGVEISPLAVEAFFEENRIVPEVTEEVRFTRYRVDEIEILCGDFFDLEPANLAGIGAIYDHASLIALPPEMRPGYAAHLQALSNPETRILLITLDYDQQQMSGPPFSVDESEVQALHGGRFAIRRLATLDVLEENQRFRERGLSALEERVYALRPK